MNDPNPYQPPSTATKATTPVGSQTSAITVYIKDSQTVVAINNEGKELYNFYRPIAFAQDCLSIVAFLLTSATSFLVLGIIAFLIANSPQLPSALSIVATATCIIVPLLLGILAFYVISPRFSFSAFATESPNTSLLSVRQHSLERSGLFRVTSQKQMTIASIVCRNSTYSTQSKWSPQSSTFYLSPRPDHSFSLWSQSATDANPREILHATKLNRQILMHSPLPSTLTEDERLLILSLFVLTLISDVKPRLFLR